jgi:hypothetical protein
MPNRGSVDARYLLAVGLMNIEESNFQLAKMLKHFGELKIVFSRNHVP